MTPWFYLFAFPPDIASSVVLLICALVWGTRSRRKTRPYLLALQAALVALTLSQVGLHFWQNGATVFTILSGVLKTSFGQLVLFWAIAWVIIRTSFAIRGRNENANIFTRNRK